MKTFFSLGMAGLIFLISTGLHAQSESQVTGCRLQALSREQETGNREQGRNSSEKALPLENQIDQRAESTTNYELPTTNSDNSDGNMHCYLMMNPTMVEESEEAIEKFIVGKTRPALPVTGFNHSENTAVEKIAEIQEFTTPSSASQQLELKDEAEAEMEVELPSQELKTSTSTDHLHRSGGSYITRAAKAAVAYLACSSMLPQAFAARESAFAVYSGLSTDSINSVSINANADGSYNMGGYLYTSIPTDGSPINGLLGKLRANGQKEWFNEQASSLPGQGIISASTIVMDGALYSGGQVYSNGWYPYISKNSPADGIPLSAWGRLDHPGYITNIFPTASNTLTCFGFNDFQNFVLEFDPDQGVVISASTITFPGTGTITEAIAMSDNSYVIGGYNNASPNQGWLSKISYNGADWIEHWTQVYSNSVGAFIMSIAEKNNTVIFSGAVNNDGFIGSVNGTTGQSNWLTSIGGSNTDNLEGVVFKSDSSLNNANEIMAVGYTFSGTVGTTKAAWYVLMNLNDGTLRKSATLDGSGIEDAQNVVANNDGTFTSLGITSSYGNSAQNLMFVTLDGNGEVDPSILPPAISYSDNGANMVVGAQTITTAAGGLTFSPLSLTLTDITSSLSVVDDPITTVWRKTASGGSSKSSSSNSTYYTIAAGGAGGVLLTCASCACCAWYNGFCESCCKKNSSHFSEPNSTKKQFEMPARGQNTGNGFTDLESQSKKQSHVVIDQPAAKYKSNALVNRGEDTADLSLSSPQITSNPSNSASLNPSKVPIVRNQTLSSTVSSPSVTPPRVVSTGEKTFAAHSPVGNTSSTTSTFSSSSSADHSIQTSPPQEVNSEQFQTETTKFLEDEICNNIYLSCLVKVATMSQSRGLDIGGNIAAEQAKKEWKAVKTMAESAVKKSKKALENAKAETLDAKNTFRSTHPDTHGGPLYEKVKNIHNVKKLEEALEEARVVTSEATLLAIQVKGTIQSAAVEAELKQAIGKEKIAKDALTSNRI